MDYMIFDIQRFADAGTLVNATGTYINAYSGATTPFSGVNTLTPGMKTFYDTALLENARGNYVFSQFGRKQALPANRGKVIEWRKFNTLPDAQLLTEGVIPTGRQLGQTTLTSGIVQYGDYVTLSDLLDLHHVDNVMLAATEEQGEAAGRTQDTLIRNVLMEGTNVMYADTLDSSGNYASTPTGRWGMSATNNRLTPDMIAQAVTFLKKQRAPQIDNKYVAVIHPSVVYDLRSNPDWIDAHKYATPEEIYNGEIGELHGVRFVETDRAMVWSGTALAINRYLTCTVTYVTNDTTATAPDGGITSAYKLTIGETPTAAMVDRYCHIYDASATAYVGTVKIVGIDASNKYIWLDSALGITPTASDQLFPGEGGAESITGTTGCAVYATTFFGKDAFGIIDPDGGGLSMIHKPASQIGGPLEQFSTVGYKFETGTKVLYEERMLRVESCSKYSLVDETN